MKNFRKVLALILVVATLFSFTAMASAKEYTDADKVTADYAAAVDVLSAIGILNGYTDGSFKPTQNIEREEMAKMVAVLANAGDDVSELYASACTFADAKNSWAASYIAYCNQTGIIAGRSATTFDPDANVTGLETAKMLLCVLGFDAAEQGYVGSNWKVNVLRDAKNFGLLDGFAEGYDVSKAITREEAAQMFLNALKANIVVGTISNNIVKISNALYFDVLELPNLTLKDAEKYGETWVVVYGNVVISNVPLASIYKGLELTADVDCYGNPGYVWSYMDVKGNTVFSKFYGYAPDYKYTTYATLQTSLKAELNSQVHEYDVVVFVEGNLTDLTVAEAEALTGNGVLTLVYVDDVSHTIVITIKHTFIGEVTSINKAKNTFTVNGMTFSNSGYNFAEGDVILYWLCQKDRTSAAQELHSAKLADVETGTVTRVTTAYGEPAYSTVVADGKTYEYAYGFANNIGQGPDGTPVLAPENVGKSYHLFLDEYGYIMYYAVNNPGTETGVGYFVEWTNAATLDGKDASNQKVWTYTADYVDFDGVYHEDVVIDKALYDEMVKRNGNEDDEAEGILVYYKKSGDKFCWVENAEVDAAQLKVGTGKITNVDGEFVAWATNSTKYLIRTWDYTKGEYKYTAVTGKNNIDASYVGQIENAKTLQYFADDDTHFASYVFVDALYAVSSNNAFILGYAQSVGDVTFVSQIGAYDAYYAIVNGEDAYVCVTRNTVGVPNAALERGMYESKLEVVGLTDDGVPVYANASILQKVNTDEFYYNAGVLYYYVEGEIQYVDWDDTMIVVVFQNGTFKVLEDNSELNDYIDYYGWDVVAGWLVSGALYIDVAVNP